MCSNKPLIEGSLQGTDREELCPMPNIAKLIGGKWKLIVLQILIFQGTKRFIELRRLIDGITQTMLTNQLRALEADGLVTRTVYAEVPPRVEYTATPRGMAPEFVAHLLRVRRSSSLARSSSLSGLPTVPTWETDLAVGFGIGAPLHARPLN